MKLLWSGITTEYSKSLLRILLRNQVRHLIVFNGVLSIHVRRIVEMHEVYWVLFVHRVIETIMTHYYIIWNKNRSRLEGSDIFRGNYNLL